jgi:hypothetical protein
MGRSDAPKPGSVLRPYDGPKVGRRVRVLAKSEALADPTWYTGVVVATRLDAFQMRMDGLSPAWFKTNERWFYAEALFAKPKTEPNRGDLSTGRR